MIDVTYNGDDIRHAINKLGDVDKKLVLALRRDIKAEIRPLANRVESLIPVQTPLSGLNRVPRNSGGWYPARSYGAVKVTPSLTPGRRRGGRSGTSELVSLGVQQVNKNAGFVIVEHAGSASGGGGNSPQGIAFIRNLNRVKSIKGRDGRFAWRAFVSNTRMVTAAGERIVNRFAGLLNSEGFGSGR